MQPMGQGVGQQPDGMGAGGVTPNHPLQGQSSMDAPSCRLLKSTPSLAQTKPPVHHPI